jgi:hypothetical protein
MKLPSTPERYPRPPSPATVVRAASTLVSWPCEYSEDHCSPRGTVGHPAPPARSSDSQRNSELFCAPQKLRRPSQEGAVGPRTSRCEAELLFRRRLSFDCGGRGGGETNALVSSILAMHLQQTPDKVLHFDCEEEGRPRGPLQQHGPPCSCGSHEYCLRQYLGAHPVSRERRAMKRQRSTDDVETAKDVEPTTSPRRRHVFRT